MDIETSVGKFVLKNPTAGERNKALIASTKGSEEPNQFQFFIELLPTCILEHPLGHAKPLKVLLDAMSVEDYDFLMEGLGKMVKPKGDAAKK